MAGNAGSMVILSAQTLVLMPLYLKYIGPRLYGAWLGTGDMLVWLQAFDLGLPNLMIQRIGSAHGRNDMASIGAWFGSGMLVLSVISAVLALAGAVLAAFLPGWMGLAGSDAVLLRSCFTISAIATAGAVLNNGFVGFTRGIQDTARMNLTMLASVLVSFATAAIAIMMGFGLWAPAFATVARAATLLAGGLFVVTPHLRGPLKKLFRVDSGIVRELASILPATALGGLGYAAMNQSQVAMAALFLRPEAAVILSATRKAADMLRSIADITGASVYGGFASLVESGERYRARAVFHQICALRSAVVIAGAAGYLAVNHALVCLWVGPRHYGGRVVTILIAIESTPLGRPTLSTIFTGLPVVWRRARHCSHWKA